MNINTEPITKKTTWKPFIFTFCAGFIFGVIVIKAIQPSPTERTINALSEMVKTGARISEDLNKNPEVHAASEDLLKTGMTLMSETMKREIAEKKAEADRIASMSPAERREYEATKRAEREADQRHAIEGLNAITKLTGASANLIKATAELDRANSMNQQQNNQNDDEDQAVLEATNRLLQSATSGQ